MLIISPFKSSCNFARTISLCQSWLKPVVISFLSESYSHPHPHIHARNKYGVYSVHLGLRGLNR